MVLVIALLFTLFSCVPALDVCKSKWKPCYTTPRVCTSISYICCSWSGCSTCSKEVCTPSTTICLPEISACIIPGVKQTQDLLNNLYSQIDTGTKKLAQLTKDLADTTAKTTTNLVTSGLNSLKAKLAVVDKVKAIPGALEKVPVAFRSVIDGLVNLGKVVTQVFDDDTLLSTLRELLDLVLDWIKGVLMDPAFLDEYEGHCFPPMIKAGGLGFSTGVSTRPSLLFGLEFKDYKSYQCFQRTSYTIRYRLANRIPDAIKLIDGLLMKRAEQEGAAVQNIKWTVVKIAALEAIKRARANSNSTEVRWVNSKLCSARVPFPNYDVPATPSTGIEFFDTFAKVIDGILDMFSSHGALSVATNGVCDGLCAGSDPKNIDNFLKKVEIILTTLDPPSVLRLILRNLFGLIDKTSINMKKFAEELDFSPTLMAKCRESGLTDNQQRACKLALYYAPEKIRCVQNALKNNTFGWSVGFEFGIGMFPKASQATTYRFSGLDQALVSCVYGGCANGKAIHDKAFADFMSFFINDVYKLNLFDFNPILCPNPLLDCSPGKRDSLTCICICPRETHIATPDGCIPCPTSTPNSACSGAGLCYLDPLGKPSCLCKDKTARADCSKP